MKLWQKGFEVEKSIEDFTVGKDRELDLWLAKYDIQGSLAHIKMLASIDLLEESELVLLEKALKKIYQTAENGTFEIGEGMEDVHSQVEYMLTAELGDMGKKIHSGRSRNDQVLVDLRLFIRAEIRELTELLQALFDTLMGLSEKHKAVLMPGYTHTQIAMVSSFGLWFGAYAESLVDDLMMLQSVYKINNQNPLGSAAGFGSSFPLNRRMTTDLLGFDDLNYNVIHAQLGRGKTERFLSYSMAAIAATVGKLAADVCLYINQNFGFIAFPNELTTGSSIMPHKKNPDVFELIRARCNQLQALPNEISLLTTNLISGYHRDFQLTKETLFPAIENLKSCLKIADYAMAQIVVKTDVLDNENYQYLYSVEEVNRLVLEGVPFRDAYKIVGEAIENQSFKPKKEVAHTHEGSLGNLCSADIQRKMDKVLASFEFEKVDAVIGELIKE